MPNDQYRHNLQDVMAIRWYINEIENKANEAYMGNTERITALIDKLQIFRQEMEIFARSSDRYVNRDCPWGCGSNICRPDCRYTK